jgi:hypothetical protein
MLLLWLLGHGERFGALLVLQLYTVALSHTLSSTRTLYRDRIGDWHAFRQTV